MRSKIRHLVTRKLLHEFWDWACHQVGVGEEFWKVDLQARIPIYDPVYRRVRYDGVIMQIRADLKSWPFEEGW